MNNLVQVSLKRLVEKKIPNPELDLRILIKYASKTKKEIFLSNLNLNDINLKFFEELLSKRLNYEPISKIINKKNFWKDEFFVDSNVLDPRPETELIIEEVLNVVKNKNTDLKILDIGTGSGCLAISLAKELKNSRIIAIDISRKAIEVAKKNIKFHNLNNQIQAKLLDINLINKKFDLIVSNPPYLNPVEYNNTQIEIKKFEPKVALLGGEDGFKFYRLFANKIEHILKKKSYFICEIGHGQLEICKDIFSKSNLTLKKISRDLNKIDRTLTFFNI